MKCKLIAQTPSGRNQVVQIHIGLAWAAARGIARDTHCAVILYGKYGTARFHADGSGIVEWNDLSTLPGEKTKFSPATLVCIN